MNDILVFENLKTHRLVRPILTIGYLIWLQNYSYRSGDQIWFLSKHIILKRDENNFLNHAFWSLDLDAGSGLMIARNCIIFKWSKAIFCWTYGIIVLRRNFVETLDWPGKG